MSFLRLLVSPGRVLHRLSGVLVRGLVILFAVMHGSGAVSMCGEFVKFRGSLVRVFWHIFPPGASLPQFEQC